MIGHPPRALEIGHPDYVWTEPSHANLPLDQLRREFIRHVTTRSNRVASRTADKYAHSLRLFQDFLSRAGKPEVLGSLNEGNINGWLEEVRRTGRSEEGIAGDLSAIKVFAHGYVYKHLELTTVDLLRKVSRITPPERDPEILTDAELDRLLAVFNKPRFEDRRNAAFVAVLAATGARLAEILGLRLSAYDPVARQFVITGKGDVPRFVRLSDRSWTYLKAYLRIRPRDLSEALWVTADGEPLGKWGVQSIMRRAKARSGIKRFHAHLLRIPSARLQLRRVRSAHWSWT